MTYPACRSGRCDQGDKPCPTPEACTSSPSEVSWRLNDAVVIAITLIALALGMAGVFG